MPTPDPKDVSYLKPGLPVFSFAYALYCDPAYGAAHSKLFFEAAASNRPYFGYLDAYRRDATRRFPKAVVDLSQAVSTSGNRDQATGRYLPTRAQAWDLMPFLVRELSGVLPPASQALVEPAPGPASPPSPAITNPDRPLFSCLAAIFINEAPLFRSDPTTFLAAFDLTPQARATLLAFSKAAASRLTEGQALSLTPDLVEETITWPASW
jgi:hypothetical protein